MKILQDAGSNDVLTVMFPPPHNASIAFRAVSGRPASVLHGIRRGRLKCAPAAGCLLSSYSTDVFIGMTLRIIDFFYYHTRRVVTPGTGFGHSAHDCEIFIPGFG